MAAEASSSPKGEERRKFCRVDDGVILRYRVATEDEIPNDIEQIDVVLPNRFTMASTFAATTQHLEPMMRQIQGQSKEVAEYLRLLEHKLSLVARSFLSQEMDLDAQSMSPVNLSAGGISFYTETPYPAGSILEIELVLLPSYTGILTYGKVIYRRHDPGGKAGLAFRIGVELFKLRTIDRDLIARHVADKQSTGSPKLSGKPK